MYLPTSRYKKKKKKLYKYWVCDFSSVLRHFSRKFCLSQAIVYFRIANVSNKIAQTAFYANNNKKKNRSSTHRVFHSTALNLYLHTHSRTQTHADGVKWENVETCQKAAAAAVANSTNHVVYSDLSAAERRHYVVSKVYFIFF